MRITKIIKDKIWETRKRIASEKTFLERAYKHRFGTKPNLTKPVKFTEKVQWLKLYYRPNGLHQYADKYEVREYIAREIGPQYLNELIGVWDKPIDINFDKLPNAFALKTTHASATNIICDNKKNLDWTYAQEKLSQYMNRDLYSITKEWAYKHIKPRVICEAYLGEKGILPVDYKYFCFNGQPRIIQVDIDRDSSPHRSMMNTEWETMPFQYHYPVPDHAPEPPSKLAEQLELARILSKPFPFVRVDFYCVQGNTYFGELTFYPASGYQGYQPASWDVTIGNWLVLPKKVT